MNLNTMGFISHSNGYAIKRRSSCIERAVILTRNNIIASDILPTQFETVRKISLLDPLNLTGGII
jgi:hypothetical protein